MHEFALRRLPPAALASLISFWLPASADEANSKRTYIYLHMYIYTYIHLYIPTASAVCSLAQFPHTSVLYTSLRFFVLIRFHTFASLATFAANNNKNEKQKEKNTKKKYKI